MDFKMLIGQGPGANERFQELSIICEEALSSEEPFADLSGFDIDTNLPHAIDDFHSHGDSDESLGILPLDLLDEANEVFSEKSSKDFLSFVKIDSEHDFIDNLNLVKEKFFQANDSLVEHGIPGLSAIHSSDLNGSEVIDSGKEENDLNMTFTFDSHTSFKFNELKAVVSKVNPDEECQSVVCTLPNILSLYKVEESPIHKAESSPKYSSTPKQDINTTFAFDEKFLNSEQNLSPVSALNKTFNKEDALQDKVMLAHIDKLEPVDVMSGQTAVLSPETGKNILNITCNISTPLHHQDELNKTFNNVFNVAKKIDVTVTYSEEIENTFNVEDDQRDKIKVATSDNEKNAIQENIQKNGLSSTIFCPEKFGNKIKALNLDECEVGLENALNIPTLSKAVKKFSHEEIIETNLLDKTQILNTTYEKIDEQPQSSKIIQSSKFQKPLYKRVGTTNISNIAKGIHSSTATSHTSAKPDKKILRKSICAPIGNNSKTLIKETLKRRQTFGSTSTENDDIIDLVSQTTKNAVTSSRYPLSKNPASRKSCSESLKFASKSNKTNAEALRNFSDLSFSKFKVSSEKNKVESSGEDQLQQKQLGETVTLIKKSVIKKSMLPPKKTSNKCEIPRLTAQTSEKKTSLPLCKQVKVFQKAPMSSVELQGKKSTFSGIPEKRVLSQKNSSNLCVPGASFTQILNRRGSSTGSSTNNHQTGSVASKIPTTTNKKICNGEKAVFDKAKICFLKNSSHHNLR